MNRLDIREEVELPFSAQLFENKVNAVLDYLKIDCWELSVLVCGAEAIRELNRNYRNTDSATDVLSFPQEGETQPDGFFYAGDLVFCPEQIAENALRFEEKLETEWLRLIIHGILHLTGKTHTGTEIDDPMIRYQEEILQELEKSV